MAVRLLLAALALLAALVIKAIAAEPPIKVTTRYAFGFAPATLVVTIRLEPHPDNRAVCLVLDGTGMYSNSCWEVDGDSARMTQRTFRDLPSGEYTATAIVSRPPDTQFRHALQFEVLPSR